MGAIPKTGDGAGLLIQIPHKFFAHDADAGLHLAGTGRVRRGMTFLPVEKQPRLNCEGVLERILAKRVEHFGWRTLRSMETPSAGWRGLRNLIYSRFLWRVRRRWMRTRLSASVCGPQARGLEIAESDIETKSSSTFLAVVPHHRLQGLLLAPQIANFYGSFDPDAASALCLVHQRFSTNTFPAGSWRIRIAMCAQRRDQHAEGERGVDACAAVDSGVSAVRR